MSDFVYIKCNLCGGDDYRVVARIGHPFIKMVRNVVCRRCGLVYQNPIMGPEALEAYYRDYRNITISLDTPTKEYEEYARPMARYHYSFFREYCRPGMNILDVGCGAGTLMSWAVEDGLHAYGINPDPGFGRYGPANYGLKQVQISLYEKARFEPHMFDIMTFNHVFEHLVDAEAGLVKARELLKEDGLLYLSIPNVMTPHGLLEYNFFLEHVNSFSPLTIELLLKKMGFRILKLSTYGYMTSSGLHHPYIDLVARKMETEVPRRMDWSREGEDYREVIDFIKNYRKQYVRENGRIGVYSGLLREALFEWARRNEHVRKAMELARRMVPGKVKGAVNERIFDQPSYCTAPEGEEFPQDRSTYYEE